MKLSRTVLVRLVGLVVLASCLVLPVGGALARAAGPSEQLSLDWSMPDRYGDTNGDGFGDQVYPPDGQALIDPGGWRVDLTVSGASCGASTQRAWWIEGARVVAGDPRLLAGGAGGCSLSYEFPAEGVYEVAFEERDQQGNLLGLVKRAITVQDFLIVSIGDSVASGEGNPEVPGVLSASWENGSAAAAQCHRSRWAGPAQAALALEQADPHSSVTFVHLACSGATILNGLLGPELPGQGPVTVQQPAQLDQLKQLIGNREIDALFVSIGANDVHFSQIVHDCLMQPDCNDLANPGSPAQHYAHDSTQLPGRYDQLASALDGLGIHANRVYLTEYFDPTHDDAGAICDGTILNDWFHNPTTVKSITGVEAQWASTTLVGGMNQLGAAAAGAHGWNRVGGITSQFIPHGYCAVDHWVVRLSESLAAQGDLNGVLHPNHPGQAVYSDRLRASASNDLLPNSTARRPFQRLVLSGQGPADSSFGDVVNNVAPGATVQLHVQLNGDNNASRTLSYSLQGPGSLSTGTGTTDSTGAATLSYTAPSVPTGCTDGPVCGVVTASFIDADGFHSDSLSIGFNKPQVQVTVAPHTITLAPGQQTTFAATVTGASDTTVGWTATGGTVDGTGKYTAGTTPGTYTVTATSHADPTASDTASVTITATTTNVVRVAGQVDGSVYAAGFAYPVSAGCGGGGTQSSSSPINTTSWGDGASCIATNPLPDGNLMTGGGDATASFDEPTAGGTLLGINASGSADATAGGDDTGWGSGTGSAGYSITFTVTSSTQMTIQANIGALGDNSGAQVLLKGPSGAAVFDLDTNPLCKTATGNQCPTQLNTTITLPGGTYFLYASAGDEEGGAIGSGSANFDLTITFT
jgi:hypothetical protein